MVVQIETGGLRDLLRSAILINLVWVNSDEVNILFDKIQILEKLCN